MARRIGDRTIKPNIGNYEAAKRGDGPTIYRAIDELVNALDRMRNTTNTIERVVFRGGVRSVLRFDDVYDLTAGNGLSQAGTNLSTSAVTMSLDYSYNHIFTPGTYLTISGTNNPVFNVLGNTVLSGNLDVTGTLTVSGQNLEDSYVNITGDDMTGTLGFPDETRIYLGTADDASIRYTGANLVIEPDEVGTGRLLIGGSVRIDEDATNPGLKMNYNGANAHATIEGPDNRSLRFRLKNNNSSDAFEFIDTNNSGLMKLDADGVLYMQQSSIKLQKDSTRIFFGAGDDGSIRWNGSDLVFDANGTDADAYCLFTSNVSLEADGASTGGKLILGATNDAELYYNGTNVILDPKITGSGGLKVSGTVDGQDGLLYAGQDTDVRYALSGDASNIYVNKYGDTMVGTLSLPDEVKLYFGFADDASIRYTGTNMVIDPNEVGNGILVLAGSTRIDEDGTNPGIKLNYGGSNAYATIEGPDNRSLRFQIKNNNSADAFEFIDTDTSGLMKLDADGVLYLEQSSLKIQTDGARAYFGAGDDGSIRWNGTDLVIDANGTDADANIVATSNISLEADGASTGGKLLMGAGKDAELYFDGTNVVLTNSTNTGTIILDRPLSLGPTSNLLYDPEDTPSIYGPEEDNSAEAGAQFWFKARSADRGPMFPVAQANFIFEAGSATLSHTDWKPNGAGSTLMSLSTGGNLFKGTVAAGSQYIYESMDPVNPTGDWDFDGVIQANSSLTVSGAFAASGTVTLDGAITSNSIWTHNSVIRIQNGGFLDFEETATPSNPSNGYTRVFLDSATGELSVLTSGGSTVSLQNTGGGTGTISGVGTSGHLAVWQSASGITDSFINQVGGETYVSGIVHFTGSDRVGTIQTDKTGVAANITSAAMKFVHNEAEPTERTASFSFGINETGGYKEIGRFVSSYDHGATTSSGCALLVQKDATDATKNSYIGFYDESNLAEFTGMEFQTNFLVFRNKNTEAMKLSTAGIQIGSTGRIETLNGIQLDIQSRETLTNANTQAVYIRPRFNASPVGTARLLRVDDFNGSYNTHFSVWASGTEGAGVPADKPFSFDDGTSQGDTDIKYESASAELVTSVDGTEVTRHNATSGLILDGSWDGPHLVLGTIHMWQATNSGLYAKTTGAPTSEYDGSQILA